MGQASRRVIIKSLSAAAGGAVVSGCVPQLLHAQVQQASAPEGGQRRRTHSPVRNIYCNQVGYPPQARKVATVILEDGPSGEPLALPPDCGFSVFALGSTQPAFTGVLAPPVHDPLSGDTVCLADFSALVLPGRYRIEVLGIPGDPFKIDAAVYGDALRLATRFFYGQRCGCKVDLGTGYKHRRCHKEEVCNASSGRTGKLHNRGGWHDAGDYGRYVVNSGITCGTLLWAWELFPDVFRNLHLDLPESGKNLPDLLAEVRWNLRWMLSMQDPADGGVWHKQTSTHFCAFIMPNKDHLPSEVIGTGSDPFKSTGATADFAAVMAIAARCYLPFDPKFAAVCLAAARRAFTWSSAHPDVLFKNPPGIATGEYGDHDTSDEILWAVAELFRTTREAAYERAALTAIQARLPALAVRPPSWGDVTSLALWTYALASSAQPTPETSAIAEATQHTAAELITRSLANGYGHTLAQADYHWGSNGDAGNQSLLLFIAHRLQPNQAAVDAALGNLHYLLGRNCFGISWVTHVGVRPYLHPHHRPSVADNIAAPWPGMLSGGPNSSGGDSVANHLPQAAPMRMWVDDERAYSMNEVAINWNAPLVFLLAGAMAAASP